MTDELKLLKELAARLRIDSLDNPETIGEAFSRYKTERHEAADEIEKIMERQRSRKQTVALPDTTSLASPPPNELTRLRDAEKEISEALDFPHYTANGGPKALVSSRALLAILDDRRPLLARCERARNEALQAAIKACESRAKAYRETRAPGWVEVEHECTQCAAAIASLKTKPASLAG